MSKFKAFLFWSFGFGTFVLVSDFVFRASDFGKRVVFGELR
jgi:hypothetical protein